MNPNLARLQPYPFERLNALKAGLTPPTDKEHIALSIGEPKHPTPSFINETIISHLHGLTQYPLTRGSEDLRTSIANWLSRRFNLPSAKIDANKHILPVNGTREALFAFAQCVVEPSSEALVLMPNPFYQIYEGAALLAGATPHFLNSSKDSNYLADFSQVTKEQWQACQLLYICSPGNPTGAVMDKKALTSLFALADQYDFIIAADECYSELYFDENKPPMGLLQACIEAGRDDFKRCIIFHSLSKRSNAPGLRSGFVAGDAGIIAQFLKYRTYHGCAMSMPTQAASTAAWSDESHVLRNRNLYREKFAKVIKVLQAVIHVEQPDAGFYLWVKTPISDTDFARDLFASQNVTVLPGSYLSRDTDHGNPGAGYVRMALVAEIDECVEAAMRIKEFIKTL